MNSLNIENRSQLEKKICGAIASAIAAHGPITNDNKASAAKRVYGILKATAREQRKNENIQT